jgi:hypothetical protein
MQKYFNVRKGDSAEILYVDVIAEDSVARKIWQEQLATYHTSRHSMTVQLIRGSIVQKKNTGVAI